MKLDIYYQEPFEVTIFWIRAPTPEGRGTGGHKQEAQLLLGWPTHGAKSWRSRSSNVISCPIVSMGPCLTGGRDVTCYFHFRGSKLAHQMSLNVKNHDSPGFAGQM